MIGKKDEWLAARPMQTEAVCEKGWIVSTTSSNKRTWIVEVDPRREKGICMKQAMRRRLQPLLAKVLAKKDVDADFTAVGVAAQALLVLLKSSLQSTHW